MPTVIIDKSEINILDLLVETNLCPSKSEAKRMVLQGGVKINNEKVIDENLIVKVEDVVLQKGKKNIIKVVCK